MDEPVTASISAERVDRDNRDNRSTSPSVKKGLSPQKRVAILLLSVFGLIVLFFFATVFTAKYTKKWKSTLWLLNGDQAFSYRSLLLGMLSAMAFGFIDNAGLFFGMDALDAYLPGDELVRAGWGNTFSDGVGAFLGAFVGKIVILATGFQGGPVYADFIGIVIGCILGIYIPKAIKDSL